MTHFLSQIPIKIWRILALAAIALLTLVSFWMALRLHIWPLYAVPVIVVVTLQVIYNYRPLFFLMVFSLPVSLQYEFGTAFAIDVFSELLMLVFLLVFVLNTLAGRQFSRKGKVYVFHILIFLILFWTFFTTLTSEFVPRSTKFLLAKLWYLAAFVYMAEKIIENPKSIRQIFWAFFIPMIVAVTGITLRHASEGFSFEASNGVAYPLFANGVIYAATLVLFIPWCWYARTWYSPRSLEWYVIHLGIAILAIATILTYKRGAWLALMILPLVDFAVKRKVFDKIVYIALLVTTLALAYLLNDNKFYEFAPNYQKTIWHEGDIQGHLQATLSGTEISSMERFYRWVAAKNMIADMPLTGSGPSTFNQVYKRYTDDAFRTYVSDNPEQSTTHNYFLLTFSEQGLIGGFLFLALCVYMVVKASRLYPRMENAEYRSILMMALLSLITILFHSLLNELIEVDKIGPMFWLCLVIIHKLEVWHEKKPITG
ncbi:MAG: O-antigen ligase family protein [Bacteroidia bacterium]|nr:O-antigen ligase family protein [Bacteroidia bacterium]